MAKNGSECERKETFRWREGEDEGRSWEGGVKEYLWVVEGGRSRLERQWAGKWSKERWLPVARENPT